MNGSDSRYRGALHRAMHTHRKYTTIGVLLVASAVTLGPGSSVMFDRAGRITPEWQRHFIADAVKGGVDPSRLFERAGFRLQDIRATREVPRILLASLPSGFHEITVPAERKALFISLVLPLILHVNETVSQTRTKLLGIIKREAAGRPMSRRNRRWLAELRDHYDVEGYDELLKAIDIIPPSLAIAQAAEESGWGTSRFARNGNALFGQRIYRKGKPGMVPSQRAAGETFRVRSYDSLFNSVFSYVHNLNSHAAYEEFREARAAMRREGRTDGESLVHTLRYYSTRRDAYVETIRKIIRTNDLQSFDTAVLR